jgi:hypothetical protein
VPRGKSISIHLYGDGRHEPDLALTITIDVIVGGQSLPMTREGDHATSAFKLVKLHRITPRSRGAALIYRSGRRLTVSPNGFSKGPLPLAQGVFLAAWFRRMESDMGGSVRASTRSRLSFNVGSHLSDSHSRIRHCASY